MSRLTISTVIAWDMAHRLGRKYQGKCASLHGHRYTAEITLDAPKLDDHGMIVDFGEVKRVCKSWIDDRIDHATIVDVKDVELLTWLRDQKQKHYVVEFSTTVEQLIVYLADRLQEQLLSRCDARLSKIRLFETPNNWADWEIDSDE